jgi:aspartate aminotransferase
MNQFLSNRARNIEESKSLQFFKSVKEVMNQGHEVVSLIVGEPDTRASLPVVEATIKALQEGKSGYSMVAGEPELRSQLANYYNKKGWHVTDKNFFVSAGSKQSLYNLFQVLINPGDEVIIFKPYWVTFPESVKLAGGVPKFVECDAEFLPNIDSFKKSITKKTKLIILNNPNNPSGVVYPEKCLREIFKLAEENDLLIISDEAYDALVFNKEFKELAPLLDPEMKRVITTKTFSKTFSMTGFRLGFTIAPEALFAPMDKFQGHMMGNCTTFAQYGAIAALNTSDKELEKYRATYQRRGQIAYELFSPLVKVLKPQGAFYLFADIRPLLKGTMKTSEEFCLKLLKDQKLALLPGSAFGLEGYIRISFAAGEDSVVKGASLLKKFLEAER